MWVTSQHTFLKPTYINDELHRCCVNSTRMDTKRELSKRVKFTYEYIRRFINGNDVKLSSVVNLGSNIKFVVLPGSSTNFNYKNYLRNLVQPSNTLCSTGKKQKFTLIYDYKNNNRPFSR